MFNEGRLNALVMLLPGFMLLHASATLSHKGATGIIKQRMDSMKEMETAAEAMADMVKNKAPFDPDLAYTSIVTLELHAQTLLDYFCYYARVDGTSVGG